MLNQGDRRLRLLPWEDLSPPVGVRGGDPSATTKALVGMDAAIQWPSRQATHQLGVRRLHLARLRPARSLPPSIRLATA